MFTINVKATIVVSQIQMFSWGQQDPQMLSENMQILIFRGNFIDNLHVILT